MTNLIRPLEATRNWTVEERLRRFTIYKQAHAYEDLFAESSHDPVEEDDY